MQIHRWVMLLRFLILGVTNIPHLCAIHTVSCLLNFGCFCINLMEIMKDVVFYVTVVCQKVYFA